MCPHKKKATGPTPLGCICNQDLFVLFLVFTPKREGKICTKGGFCVPKRECVPKQKLCPKRKQQDRCHWGAFSKKTFVLFFWSFPRMWGQNPRQRRFFVPPKRKSCLTRKQHDRRHGDVFAIKTFFWSPKFSMPPSSPAHYSGARSASMNRSEIRLKIVFLEDHNITSISTVCLGFGEDLFLFRLEITSFPKLFAIW